MKNETRMRRISKYLKLKEENRLLKEFLKKKKLLDEFDGEQEIDGGEE